MITIYKKNSIPKEMENVEINDVYFNRYTVELLDDKAAEVILRIDNSEMVSKYAIKSKFDGMTLNIDRLSTGCKTVLNIMYNPNKVFDIRECGENALDAVYSLPSGNVCCGYPLISFDMQSVIACDKKGRKEISSYEELKDWWSDEK